MELDALDRLAAEAFDGLLVRKDLALKFKGQYPVPTYVGEFLLGRYCASTDENEIAEGLEIVEQQLRERTVRAGEEELFKSRAREQGHGQAHRPRHGAARRRDRLPTWPRCPACSSTTSRIDDDLVRENERMLTGGFYAEVDARVRRRDRPGDEAASPFGIVGLRPIQLSKRDVARRRSRAGARRFTIDAVEATSCCAASASSRRRSTERAQDVLLLRMVPFVERNYNMVELGPRGTGKSHLFQQVSPYAHLVSGGKATVAKMFVNNAHRPARPRRPVRRRLLRRGVAASPSTRRTASTS